MPTETTAEPAGGRSLRTRLMSVLHGDKHMAAAYPPHWQAGTRDGPDVVRPERAHGSGAAARPSERGR